MLLLLLACSDPQMPAPPVVTSPAEGPQNGPPGPPPQGTPSAGVGLDQGQQHPPLPADNPAWDQDVQGFVASPQWYGEHDWEGVHMRTLGHIAVIRRDRARFLAESGDLKAAASEYQGLAEELALVALREQKPPDEIRDLLVAAAQRDAALCAALAEGRPIPTDFPGLYGMRMRYLELAGRQAAGQDVRSDAQVLAEDLRPYTHPPNDLAIDDFKDFDARHALRVRLFAAALDAQDPLHLNEPWGYWTAEEAALQGMALALAARALAEGEARSGAAVDWPNALVSGRREAQVFTVEGLGWLPTGDSLIDVGAQPGPKAIGSLQKWGLDDAEHRARLERVAAELNAETDPDKVLAGLRALVSELDAGTHGSRFYNVKQVRNEGVRVLASQGHPAQALALLDDNLPLHHQDWACPNREGILLALRARLVYLSGRAGRGTWFSAWEASGSFLETSTRAQKGEKVGVQMPGPPGQPGPPRGGQQAPGPGQPRGPANPPPKR